MLQGDEIAHPPVPLTYSYLLSFIEGKPNPAARWMRMAPQPSLGGGLAFRGQYNGTKMPLYAYDGEGIVKRIEGVVSVDVREITVTIVTNELQEPFRARWTSE